MMSAKQRYFWADIIRVLAISLVITVHAFDFGTGINLAQKSSLLIIIIAKNCIPLFLMLSGALLLPKKEKLSVFFSKRVRRILLPWLFWAGVFFLLTQSVDWLQPWLMLLQFKSFFINQFTYLPMILALYLLMPLFKTITQRDDDSLSWYFVMLWFLGISLLPYLENSLAFPLRVDNGLVRQSINYSGFLFLGHLLAKLKIKKHQFWWLSLLFLSSVLGSYCLVQIGPKLRLVYAAYNSPLIIISSGSLFLLVKNWAEKISHSKIVVWKNLLKKLSQASFGVFLVHGFILNWLEPQDLWSQAGFLTKNLGLFALTWILSFSLILGLRRIEKVRSIVA